MLIKNSRKISVILFITGMSFSERGYSQGLLFDEPASTLEDSYRGRYGADQGIEGPYYEDEAKTQSKSENVQGDAKEVAPRNLFSLGVGLTNGFALDLSYTYFYNRFIATEYGFNYSLVRGKEEGGSTRSEQYGPRLIFLFLLTNPTIFTPILGAGPSYEVWRRASAGSQFDANHALVGNSLVGANLQLSKYFIMQLALIGRHYLFDRPKSFPPANEFVAKSEKNLQLRFLVQF